MAVRGIGILGPQIRGGVVISLFAVLLHSPITVADLSDTTRSASGGYQVYIGALKCGSAGGGDYRFGSSADWPQHQGNPQHTGYNAADWTAPPLSYSWHRKLIDGPLGAAAIVGDRVLVTPWKPGASEPNGAFIWCFDIDRGDTLWLGSFGSASDMSKPSVSEGLVYVSAWTSAHFVAALDVTSGELRWATPYSAQISHSVAPTIYGNRVFNCGNTYGGMHVFDALTGSFIWRVKQPDTDEWTPAVYQDRAYSFVVRRLYINDVSSGALLGYLRPDSVGVDAAMHEEKSGEVGQGNSPVLDTTNMIVYCTEDSAIWAVDVSAQPELLWKHKDDGYYRVNPVLCDTLLIAMSKPDIRVFHALTGELLWTFQGGESFDYNYPPVVANGYLYASSPVGTYAIDLETHEAVWYIAISGFLSVGNGHLFISTHEGELWALKGYPTDVNDPDEPVLPSGNVLYQNQPNPFNPTTEISFSVPVAGRVQIEILNSLGQVVATVADRTFSAGSHTVNWDGSGCASGVYLYRMTAGEYVETKKMVLVK